LTDTNLDPDEEAAMAAPTAHPSDKTLQSYGLGKLDDLLAEAVVKHLKECDSCRRRVAEVTSDSFVGRLQDAQARPETIPPVGSSLAGLSKLGAESRTPSPPPASTLPPGLAEHPDYQVLRELGRGGMGVVYLAENRMMGRKEVLKVVSSHLLNRQGVLERFLREIRSAASLNHPNIVTAYSASRVGENIVFSMQFVEGYDLSQLVNKSGPLSVAHACNFVYQAALGLQHAHERGMVHRDIKPSNLMLARDGNKPLIKVLDFGLAKVTSERAVDGGLTSEGQMLGSPHYVAPEQTVDAQKADIRADIYSLGCTLYCLLAGHPPFDAPSLYELLQAHHSMDAKPLNFIRPEVPAELAAVVAKMLAKEPERRFQTPNEVAQALTPFFKKGNVASTGSKPELSQAGRPDAKPVTAGAGSVATRPTAELAPAPAPSVGKPVATPRPEAMWSSLVDFKETEPVKKAAPAAASKRRPPWLWPAVAAGVLFFGFVVAWGTGVLKIKTPEGFIVLKDLPDQAMVVVDDKKATVHWPDGGGPAEIVVAPGDHMVQVKKDGFTMKGQKVTVETGGKTALIVELEPSETSRPGKHDAQDSPRSDANKPPVATSAERVGIEPARVQASDAARLPNRKATILSGSWRVEENELVQNGGQGTILPGDTPLSSFDMRFQGQIVSGNEGFVALFHRTSGDNVRFFHVGELGGKRVDLGFLCEGKEGGQSKPIATAKGRWYNVLVKVRSAEFWCYLDGQELFHDVDERFAQGRIGLATWDANARYRDIVITTPDGKVLWEGPPDLPG